MASIRVKGLTVFGELFALPAVVVFGAAPLGIGSFNAFQNFRNQFTA
jgi:hypothetical protein